MHVARANALRRTVIAAAAMLAALAAHMLGLGAHDLTLRTPVIMVAVLTVAALIGRRRGTFRARGPVRTFALLCLFQALAHAVLTDAPWALGLDPLCETAMVSPASGLAHILAALLLTALVTRLEQLLGLTIRVVEAVRRLLATPPRRRGAAPSVLVPVMSPHAPRPAPLGAVAARGPPLAALI